MYDSLFLLGDKKENPKQVFFDKHYSNGLKTNRDGYCYNFSESGLIDNIQRSISFYNNEIMNFQEELRKNPYLKSTDFLNMDSTKFIWDRQQKETDSYNGKLYEYDNSSIRECVYRPFTKENVYFNRELNNCVYQLPQLFPNDNRSNLIICVPGLGSTKCYSSIISKYIVDLGINSACQCFPLYWYEENKVQQLSLFDANGNDGKYIRHDGITDWIL